MQLISKQIKPIYELINQVKSNKTQYYKRIPETDIILNIKNEVNRWVESQKNEIIELKANEKYRKEFLGNVSHELKTPIFNIQGYLLTLLDTNMSDPSINKRYLERAEKNLNRLISVVDDLETISKLESGELKLKFKEFDIVELIEEVFEIQEINAAEYQVETIFKEKYAPIQVYADHKRIYEVLDNLINNSIKYNRRGGKVIVELNSGKHAVSVKIQDTGIGISKKHLPRIFERFYRVDKSRSRQQGGTGLGLAIVKHIIEAHGENIKIVSKKNVGTSFVFFLAKAASF